MALTCALPKDSARNASASPEARSTSPPLARVTGMAELAGLAPGRALSHGASGFGAGTLAGLHFAPPLPEEETAAAARAPARLGPLTPPNRQAAGPAGPAGPRPPQAPAPRLGWAASAPHLHQTVREPSPQASARLGAALQSLGDSRPSTGPGMPPR